MTLLQITLYHTTTRQTILPYDKLLYIMPLLEGELGEGGFGGLFRDKDGSWLMGHYGKLSYYTSAEAEFRSI